MSEQLGRASAVMAAGTLASRATGFLRTVAMLAALGSATRLADVYNVTNVIPNVVYDLVLGGVLASVVIPVLVRAGREDDDGGLAFAQSALTATLVLLVAITGIGLLAAPWIASAYGLQPRHGIGAAQQREVAVTFLRFFLPQMIFYGVGAVAGAILNTRGRFGAPMLAPVLNNLVVIVTFGVFLALPGGTELGALTRAQTLTLAIGTTLGVVAMTLALYPALRAVGVRWRWRIDLSHPGLRQAARLAGWVLGYAVVNQIGYLVITRIAASVDGFTTYSSAYQVFQLPYAIIAVSVITALMPRLSRHALDQRADLLQAELSRGIRTSAVLLVPAAALLATLGTSLATVAFAHGHTTPEGARLIGWVLAAFAAGLVPFSIFQLQIRLLYAGQDSRTPFRVNLVVTVVNVLADLAAVTWLPRRDVPIGLAGGLALSYLIGALLLVRVLRRRLGGIDGRRVSRLLSRVTLAAGAAAAVAGSVAAVVSAVAGRGVFASGVTVVLGGGLGWWGFTRCARLMRVRELATLTALLARLPLPRFRR